MYNLSDALAIARATTPEDAAEIMPLIDSLGNDPHGPKGLEFLAAYYRVGEAAGRAQQPTAADLVKELLNRYGSASKFLHPERRKQKGDMMMNGMIKTTGTLGSREVAKMVGKRHADLLRDIETYIEYMENSGERKIASANFFTESTYIDEQGKSRKCYDITKQGCEMIANKLTGAKGIQFTALYVQRFNQMEEGQAARTPIIQNPEHKHMEVEARLNNSRARIASEMRKFAEMIGIPDSYKQVLASKATEIMTGQNLLALPEAARRTYTATEIGAKFGISANKVGHLANDNGLKTAEYGLEVWDKSPYSAKQVSSWRYYDTAIPVFGRILGVPEIA